MDRGTTTTPFEMVVLKRLSRYHLAMDALHYVPRLQPAASGAAGLFERKLSEHRAYIREHLEDMPEIQHWRWTADFRDPVETAPPPASGPSFTDA
jgi:xylulose-5-phosphate/fructose-6-phosphate phosphoketolase